MKGAIMSDQVVYTSKARIERVKGPLRRAYLPKVKEPVLFGVHSELDDLEGDAALHGLDLLCEVDDAHAALADRFEDLVGAD